MTEPPKDGVAVFWAPSDKEDFLAAAQFFAAHPTRRATALLRERFFPDTETGAQARDLFRVLVAERRLEVLLVLPNAPLLALVMDTDVAVRFPPAGLDAPPRYAWPQDVASQLNQAQSHFRRMWRTRPGGMLLPGNFFSGEEGEALRRSRISWVLSLATTTPPGFYRQDELGVVVPVPFPKKAAAERRSWALAHVHGVSSAAVRPPIWVSTVDELNALSAALGDDTPWNALGDYIPGLAQWPPADLTRVTFAPWVGESEENLAWRLLGQTRMAVEEYQNSGSADLKRLDLALNEIYKAEDQRFFYVMGDDTSVPRKNDLKREFLATLAQVYRLMGRPVPPLLMQGFPTSVRDIQEGTSTETNFEQMEDGFLWRDKTGDDRGPGNYFYPVGRQYVTGSWDLHTFQVTPSPEHIGFQVGMAALPNPGAAPGGFSLPLVDVYIDINHTPGAGSGLLLKGRPGVVESQNAWEYALSVDGWGARLYQYSPDSAPRKVATLPVARTAATVFGFDVPRHYLRGDPDHWRYAVLVMGRGMGNGDPAPMPVDAEPGVGHFGGAWEGVAPSTSTRAAPPFIDVLCAPGTKQSQVMGVYRQGREMVVPFLEPH